MANVFKQVISKVGGFLARQPVAPQVTPIRTVFGGGPGGHRGIAAGSLKPGEQDLSAENVGRWRTLTAEEGDDFIFREAYLPVHSTNVAAAQYFLRDQKMMVEFKDGSAYLYSNVSQREAEEFLQAASKGGFLWDAFRVRGSKTAHRKPYTKLR